MREVVYEVYHEEFFCMSETKSRALETKGDICNCVGREVYREMTGACRHFEE